MSDTTHYLLKEENGAAGLFRVRVIENRIADPDILLKDLASQEGLPIHNAFNATDSAHANVMAKLLVKKTHITVSTRLSMLRMLTTFELETPAGPLVPMFKKSPSHQRDLIWLVPHDLALFFAVKILPKPWRIERAYLFCTSPLLKGTYSLPLPNQYGDARLCLGDSIYEVRKYTLADTFAAALDRLNNSDWNEDAFPEDMSKPRRMFRFDPESGKYLGMKEGTKYEHVLKLASQPTIEEAIL